MDKKKTTAESMEARLNAYASTAYPLHMPGHKRRATCVPASTYAIDVTEVAGTDNLYHPGEMIKDALWNAREFYGTRKTYFLLNGSTGGILTAVAAMSDPGDKVLIMRSCHQSVYHAAELNRIEPIYLFPEEAAENLTGGICLNHIHIAYRDNPDIKGCIITSPTYEGLVQDVSAIAGAMHQYGGWLIVDEAHGAHFNYSEHFPASAVGEGADIVIQSLHKTMPSMTQTALMHAVGEQVDLERLDHYYGVYQTSSPSYVFMASIDNCIRHYQNAVSEWSAFKGMISGIENKLSCLKNLKLMRQDNINMSGLAGIDRSKILIGTLGSDMTGLELEKELKERYGFQVELSTEDYILAMLSVADDSKRVLAFAEALLEIDRRISVKQAATEDLPPWQPVRPKTGCSMEEAWKKQGRWKQLSDCEGDIVQVSVVPYPPGIPCLASGEVVQQVHIDWLAKAVEKGRFIKGLRLENHRILIKIVK